MTAGFADDDWGFVYSAKFQRMINDWNKLVSGPAFQQNISAAISRQIDTTQFAKLAETVVASQIDTTKFATMAETIVASQIDTTKFAKFAEAITAAKVKPLVTPEFVAPINKSVSLSILNSPSYEALRKSMGDMAQTLTRNHVFSKLAEGNLSALGPTFSTSVDSFLAAHTSEFEQLAADTSAEYEDTDETAEVVEYTDFQAYLIVRVWTALVIWGWAVEDWLSTQSDAAREKYGEQAADIRNRVIATVIAGLIVGACKLVWSYSTPK